MNTLYKLLDRLESVIMDGVPIPLLPYSMVNQEKLILLLDKIQTVIPEEIQQAEQVLSRKEEIQLESQRRAQQMLQEAKQQADILLSESELLKAVQIEADRVRHQVTTELQTLRQQAMEEVETLRRTAYEEANTVRQNADDYADVVLKTLGKNLEEFQKVAKTAQGQLKKVRVDAMQAQHPQQTITSGTPAGRPAQHRNHIIERAAETQEV